MNASQQLAAFTEHVRSLTFFFTESKSSLKDLLAYLRNSVKSPRRFSNAQDAIKKCANPNDPRLSKYRPAINSLVAVWGTPGDYQTAAPVAPPPPPSNSSKAMELVNDVKGRLEACRKYGCNDVIAFPNAVNPMVSAEEKTRIKSAGKQGWRTTYPILNSDGKWNTPALKGVYERVLANKSGECTSYAYYAGYLLIQSNITPKPRLEIVSWEGEGGSRHCYVIVGRSGGTTNGFLPPPDKWNSDCVIVDCWALTLGYQCVYNKGNYCYKDSMMNPVKIIMDSTKMKTAADAPLSKQQMGLRVTSKIMANGKPLP